MKIMTSSTAYVDQEHILVILAGTVEDTFSDGKPLDPMWSSPADARHECVEILREVWILLPPLKGWLVDVKSILERSIVHVTWLLKSKLPEILGQFLKYAESNVKAGDASSVDSTGDLGI